MNAVAETIFGRDLFGDAARPDPAGIMRKEFLVPPFSVLSARDGEWQERKRAWVSLGIQSELGRSAEAFGDASERQASLYAHTVSSANAMKYKGGFEDTDAGQARVSIFDPVLCELIYRWFCPPKGQIVDPFAGGSVRGIVASIMGFRYWGCDLSAPQIAANIDQGEDICPLNMPEWVCGDSMEEVPRAPEADLVFSCPPYADLERYSDDPRDLSTMEYHTFKAAYNRIIMRACERLKPNRFACFVVGDIRDKRGHYRNFVSDTIAAFQAQGLALYNEAILVTSVGSLPIRVGKQFRASRKLGKTHQNILVFVKGCPKMACAEFHHGEHSA